MFNENKSNIHQLEIYLVSFVNYIEENQKELSEDDNQRLLNVFLKSNSILEKLISNEVGNKQLVKNIELDVSENEINKLLKEVSN